MTYIGSLRFNLKIFLRSWFVRLVWILALPVLFTFIAFNPNGIYELKSNSDQPQYVLQSQVSTELTTFAIADLLQTSMRLGWYEICLKNEGALSINTSQDKHPIVVGVDTLSASGTGNHKLLQAQLGGSADCIPISPETQEIMVGTTTILLGTELENFVKTGTHSAQMNFTLDLLKIHLYIREPFWAFLIKCVVITLLWGGLNLLTAELYAFIFKYRKLR